MKMLKKGQKGFTLIELLIVVAIIGILAAIAIPQFAAYRQRAFNGSAQSDLRNIKTAQESLFADNNTYGITQNAALNAVTAADAGGAVLTGPLGAATATVAGAALAGSTVQDRVVGIGIALSNGVSASSYTEDAGPANGAAAASYLMYAKHTQGTRGFAVESENTGIFMVENPLFVGNVLAIGAANNVAGPVASTVGLDIVSGTTAGGGAPTAAWFLM